MTSRTQKKPNLAGAGAPRVVWVCMVFWVLLAYFGPRPAIAAAEPRDHVVSRAWVDDPSGQLGLQDVLKRPALPVAGVLGAGFGHSVIWLRLRVDPHAHPVSKRSPERLVLRVRPVYLDQIEVFDTAAAQPRVGAVGDRLHPRDGEFDSLDFSISIDRGDAPRDIWLRLTSTSTRQIHAQVFNLDDWDHANRMQQLVFSTYVAAIAILAVWGIATWVFTRERLMGAFGLKQTMALGFALTSLGYLRVFWPASWPAAWLDGLASVLSIVSVSTALLFHILFTREYGLRPWTRGVHVLILALQPFKLALLAAGHPVTALQINMVEVLLAPAFFLLCMLTAQGWSLPAGQRPILPRWLISGFYLLLFLALLIPALPALALMSGGEISLYFVQIHGLMTASMILVMLQYRARLRARQQRQTDLALERTRLQAQQEREIRQEQEKLLEMLTHELKTPLATMNLRLNASAAGASDIKRAIREMSEVINRCVQASQLDDKRLAPVLRSCVIADVVRDAIASCPEPERVTASIAGQGPGMTDPQLLFVVLSNLLENACKYAEAGSAIAVTLQGPSGPQAGAWVLMVENRPGQAGWPDPEKLFDKYYRSPQARRHSGTGLGLYLARHLVEVLGGTISYQPDAQRLRFVITLPGRPGA